MDDETRAAFAAMSTAFAAQNDAINARFDRVDRYFELQQMQFVEWRAELRGGIAELRDRVDALIERVSRVEQEGVLLRDVVTREIAEIRVDLRAVWSRSGQTEELRREISELAMRVDRLERRQSQ